MSVFAPRRQALVRSVKADPAGADAVLVTGVPNVTYLTGFTGDATYFVATPKQSVIVSDSRFEAQIAEECPEVGAAQGVELHVRPHNKTTLEAAAEVLARLKVKTVAVEANRLTVGELAALQGLAPKLTFVPRPNQVEALRAVKDATEVEQIRAAVRVAERAYGMFMAMVRETDTEKEMFDAMEGFIRRAGGRWSSFPPIIAVGERGALPHCPPSGKQLREASKLLVDWGADLLYKSDITRTVRNPFPVKATARNKFERTGHDFATVYQAVLDAQTAALKALRPGVKGSAVDAAARKALDAAGLEPYFTHGLGHGVGLEIHEAPRVRANSDDVLAAGMVITLEPGVYLPGWGGVRIEDDVLITPDGAELLTALPRDLSAAGGA